MNSIEALGQAVIDRALRAAVRAPSPHNTQPWRFEVGPQHVDLLLDRSRVLAVADPDGREARLSCGAALLNLRMALAAAGRSTWYELLPDPDRPELLARVRLAGEREPSPAHRQLADAIERRATNRHPFADRVVPDRLRWALVRAADREGGRLVLLDKPADLSSFTGLLRRAEHLQADDPAFQGELLLWTARHPDRADGVPPSAGGPRPADGAVLALRGYTATESTVERPYEQDPLVAVLATPGDTALDLVRGGQALQRVLLTATAEGLSASFLSQPTEIPAMRTALRELIGGRLRPQTVLRLGYGYAAANTPRRAVHESTRAANKESRS